MQVHFCSQGGLAVRDTMLTFAGLFVFVKTMKIIPSKIEFRPRVLDAFAGYTSSAFASDAMAGIIVAIVAALPLALAFAIASGVSPEVGLISAIVGGLLISVLSGCKVQIGGPTGSFIIIAYSVVQMYGMPGLVMATVLAGLMLLVGGLLGLGGLIKYIPYPVVMGFTAGMAVIIFSTQVNELLGLGLTDVPADFISKWELYLGNIGYLDLSTLALGLGTIATIELAPRITKAIPGSLIALILGTVVAYLLRQHMGVDTIATIGDRFEISGGMPTPALPGFDFSMLSAVAQPAFSIAILAAIESLLTARIVDGLISDKHYSNTELIGLGVANILTPLVGGMPVTGATARTMTNINNGGRTPMAGIVHAIILLLCFLFLMPFVSYIPMASLAGVLVIVSYNMSGWRTIRNLMRGPRTDVIVLWTTFAFTLLFDITFAIQTGLMLAMIFFIKRMIDAANINVSRRKLDLVHSDDDTLHVDTDILDLPEGVEVYEIEGPFFFGMANHFEEIMSSVGAGRIPPVRVIRMRFVPFMDTTAVHNLEELCLNSSRQGSRIILSGVNDQVRATLHSTRVEHIIGAEYICSDIHKALGKAREYLAASRATTTVH